LMGSCLQLFLHKFEVPGHCKNVQCLVFFFIEIFFFSQAIGLGPAAD
jgi:hypothetical protein